MYIYKDKREGRVKVSMKQTELEVGQYLMSQGLDGLPIFAKIVRVNKLTYRIKLLSGPETSINKTTLAEVSYRSSFYDRAYVPVNNDKITEEVLNRCVSLHNLEKYKQEKSKLKNEVVELVGQAKYFLEQIKDIEAVDPFTDYSPFTLDDEDDSDDYNYITEDEQ